MVSSGLWGLHLHDHCRRELSDWVYVCQASSAVMLAAIVEVLLGCTGMIGVLVRFIGPLTLCPSLALIGLSMSRVIAEQCHEHWGVAALWVHTSLPLHTRATGIRVFFVSKAPFTRYKRLSHRLNTRLNNRLHRVNKHLSSCSTHLFSGFDDRMYHVNGV